ncbi:MAG: MerR family transcriptional regulator [Candidatus Sumerlaeia bacterium]
MTQLEILTDAAESPAIPTYAKKLFYRIQEVSEITDLKPHVLRYWETEFKQLSPEKDKNDQRRYRQHDIDLIFTIKDLLYRQKFTIAGARRQIGALSKSKQRKSTTNRRQSPSRHAILNGIRDELKDLMSYMS